MKITNNVTPTETWFWKVCFPCVCVCGGGGGGCVCVGGGWGAETVVKNGQFHVFVSVSVSHTHFERSHSIFLETYFSLYKASVSALYFILYMYDGKWYV